MAEQPMIWVTSGVSPRTGEGFVNYHWGELATQFSPKEARQHALNLLAAAEAAETDAIFHRFVREKLEQPPEVARAILRDWRQHREDPRV